MENLTFSPVVTDEDRSVYLRIRNLDQNQSPLAMEQFIESDRISPAELHLARWVVRQSGAPVATALAAEERSEAGKEFFVHSGLADQSDVALLAPVHRFLEEHVRARGATRLMADARSTRSNQLAALLAVGFREVQRNPATSIDPQTFDEASWRSVVDAVRATRIEILSLDEMIARCPDEWARAYHDLDDALSVDVPRPTPYVPSPFAETLAYVQSAVFQREGRFFAVDGGQWVGLTELIVNRVDPTLAQTGLTGVLRSHRRRGIAAALKVVSLQWAREQRIRRIVTDNEANNPMFHLNLRLGYRHDYDWILLGRTL